MKSIILAMCCLCHMLVVAAQSHTNNISFFCKFWGFLKYYHPRVATGKIDWDNDFLKRVNTASILSGRQERSTYYLKWIEELGEVKECKNCNSNKAEYLDFNLDTTWLRDTNMIDTELSKKLLWLFDNRQSGENFYISYKKVLFFDAATPNYKNEKPYIDSTYPSPAMRLLTLGRYWNIIHYFYPYKYSIGKSWNAVLDEMIPKFIKAADTLAYHLAIAELNASIRDSHSPYFLTTQTMKLMGTKAPAFKYLIMGGEAVITEFYNDSLQKVNAVQRGDIILKVDGRALTSVVNEKSKYIGASNEDCKMRDLKHFLLNGNQDAVVLTIKRNDSLIELSTNLYPVESLFANENRKDKGFVWKIVDDNIGYVDVGRLEPNAVSNMMNKLNGTKAIIMDIRNYPKSVYPALSQHINKERKPFASFITPLQNFPGVYKRSKTLFTGKSNTDHYKGKIVLLIDEQTQSMAELTVMALLTAPDVLTVGNHTAGADGDVMQIPLPGGFQLSMSAAGVYFPDGRETQRTGITPDITVKPTVDGIRRGKDEVLERAIDLINGR